MSITKLQILLAKQLSDALAGENIVILWLLRINLLQGRAKERELSLVRVRDHGRLAVHQLAQVSG